jgi:Spy/CpxP family protein refolding chaperone
MHSILAVALLLLNTSYGAMTSRHIKALSHEDIQGLQEGRGMGFALAAELNSYPGPKHVLEMADDLKLTVEQRTRVQQSHDEMKSSAVALGKEIVDLERQLDEAFAAGNIDAIRLRELTAAIAERQGKLRYAHLAAHLTTRATLTAEQIKAYDAARGYGSATKHPGHH